MNTFDKLVNICSVVFEDEIDVSKITLESKLKEDIGINSVGILYMALAIEEEFGIKFTNDDFVGIETVAHVVDIIERKIQ